MLSLFPSLLTYEQIAPFLLRLSLGIIFLFWAYRKLKDKKDNKIAVLGIGEGILGILFVIGLFVQLAALIASIIFAVRLIVKIKEKAFFTDGVNYYFLLLIIALSLLVSGPGFLAFDLPL